MVGYPAHPRLIRLSVCESICDITFNFSADTSPLGLHQVAITTYLKYV
jgi:hypothetical protein